MLQLPSFLPFLLYHSAVSVPALSGVCWQSLGSCGAQPAKITEFHDVSRKVFAKPTALCGTLSPRQVWGVIIVSTGCLKKVQHKEMRLFWPYLRTLKLTFGLLVPIYDTGVCLGTIWTLILPYIVPYSPYKTTVGTPLSPLSREILRIWSAYCCVVGTTECSVG